MKNDQLVRQQLVNVLVLGQAHMTFEDAVANFPAAHINTRPPNVSYSFWHLLDHVRFCQLDILDYIRDPNYKEPKFPDDLWKPTDADTDLAGWNKTIEGFYADRQALIDMLKNPQTDIYAQIPHGYPGHTIVREILVVADHNAYHLGELAILRQVMGLWK